MTVRVRYAPSPTGHLHVGSLRTALYNYLFARHYGGTYLLRIEDTDQERSRPEFTQSILSSLAWASLEPDETPVVQSDRLNEHRACADRLIEEGKAYRCYCSPEELSNRLNRDGDYQRYDGFCRTRKPLNKPFAIRYAIPADLQNVSFTDLIRGEISFGREQLDDFIIVRTDGLPMYNFVVVLDDHFMKITHVLRGEDHISNTPKQVLLYKSLGYELPAFAHFSLILGSDGQRLSKRHMATSVTEFKKQGYLSDALCNYLVRLGWSHGDQEIFSREEMINYFTLDHMTKAGAIFDQQKLDWMNSVYIKDHSSEALYALIKSDVDPSVDALFPDWSSQTLLAMIALYKERVSTLKELIDDLKRLHDQPNYSTIDETVLTQDVHDTLMLVHDALVSLTDHSSDSIDHRIRSICKEKNLSLKQIGQPLRVALTGQTSSPGFAKLIALLSIEESSKRIEEYMKHIKRRMKR